MDFRSDTVTKPTPEMRTAMAEAVVGDDVWNDDPTVQELEADAAALFEKEAGLFVPSGTMGNLLCIMTHCIERGSEMIVGDQSHMHLYEVGGSAGVGGVHSRVVKTQPNGELALEDIEKMIRTENDHFPTTRLVCIENTHNFCGGRALSVEYMDTVGAFCEAHGLAYHVDGARVCNAAVALGTTVARLTQAADTVSCCLSKGLGAPVGSVIVGPSAFIKKARRFRKMLGGGMRQVGVLAAPGRIALTAMVDRLAEDHARAKTIAEGLDALPGISCDVASVDTNIVFFEVDPEVMEGGAVVEALEKQGVLVAGMGQRIRVVTHLDVGDAAVEGLVAAMADLFSSSSLS